MEYHRADYAEGVWDTYWFSKNLQGDITGSYTLAGSREMITYYSAFGFMKEDPNGYNGLPENPFMYRGYYYDHDLGMYYLNSRYYDQNTCRFINADRAIYKGISGCNLYTYCKNNPVNYYDPNGEMYVSILEVQTVKTGETSYQTTVIYKNIHLNFGSIMYSYTTTRSYTFEYTINKGVVNYSNKQKVSLALLDVRISSALVAEMKKQAQKQNESALAGRTNEGMVFELIAHYIASCVRFKEGQSDETNMGSNIPGNYGYDENADVFEHFFNYSLEELIEIFGG